MSDSSLVAQLINAGNLENLFDADAEQLRYWYDRISEINIDELATNDELAVVANACRLIMQYERTNAEELRELAEREAVEAAEREENWAMERETLKYKISVLRDQITVKAGFDDTNEAFRAEIDSLTSENAFLRQQARERDRELADQRDRVEELSTRLQATERERALFAQTELEKQIKELNRRINVHSDMQPQRNDWETRRLRQRNEQAIALSNQLQSVISQNEELKAETERVTMALESATVLIQEQNAKFENYAKQLSDADAFIEQLRSDIRDLRAQIAQQDANFSHTSTEVEANAKALTEVVSAKEMELNRLQVELHQRELEVEELRTHLHLQRNDARDVEIERLHHELVTATETARQLFGTAINTSHSSDSIISADPNAEFRMRIIEMDKKLHVAEKKIDELSDENSKIIREMEEKDMTNARLNSENQRLRQAAFGSAGEEINRLEQKISYRDRQIQELNRYCSLLQINLLERDEGIEKKPGEASDVDKYKHKQRKLKAREKKITEVPKRPVIFVSPPGMAEEATIEEDVHESAENHADEQEKIKKNGKPTVKHTVEQMKTPEIKLKPIKYGEIEPTITIIDAMHQEILKLNEELNQHRKDLKMEKLLRSERETLLRDAKNFTLAKQREIDTLKAIIYSDRPIDDINAELASTEDGECIVANIATVHQRCNELEVENAELRRLAENIQYNGTEFERRAAEATRRIVFLAIQNVRYERRITSSELTRRTLANEHANLRVRLQSILSGEERRSRQLNLENEEKLIEIARLQNILLHCVPWTEYRRIQRAYKRLICPQTVSDSSSVHTLDGEYHSKNGEDDDDDLERFDISIKALAAYNNEETNSNSSNGRWTDKLVASNRRLNEENEVRRLQCDFWQSEVRKKDAEIEELNAFISDIENETELKSMLVNIERRFLRMINEQSDNEQERVLYRNEARELRKNLQSRRVEWNAERQDLVKLAIHLRGLLRMVQSNRITISVSQLDAFKRATDDVKQRDKLLEERQKQIDQAASDLERKSTIFEAALSANDEILKADYQLKNIQISLQGSHMSVLTLGAKLRRAQEETATWRKLANENETRANELEKELNEFNLSTVDLRFLDRCQSEKIKTDEKFKQLAVSLEVDDSSDEFNGAEHIGNEAELTKNPSTIVIDNSAEYQRQIEALQNAAKLCVKTYEEQLLQKDKTIEDYKRLLETVRERPQSARPALANVTEHESPPRQLSERTSAQIILDSQDTAEKLQRRVQILERKLRSVQEANAALTDRLEAEVECAKHLALEAKKEMRDKIVQVKLQAHATNDRNVLEKINSAQNEKRSTESSGNQERSTSANSSQSEEPVAEADSAESETDSGTVDDIDDDRRISSGSISSQDSGCRKLTVTTIMKNDGSKMQQARKQIDSSQNDVDLLQRHRNETRRLKMRIITLEKKIKELTNENTIIRERGRFNARLADPNAEVNILRKQGERMHRENANLTKSLRDRAEEIDKLKKALKKNESINPAKLATDIWEERKRHTYAQNILKQRVADLTTQQQELQERLSRREKFIEQLTRENTTQHNNAQKILKLQNDWSAERAALVQREQTLRETVGNWMEKYHNAMSRLDSLIKEKNSLNQRFISLQKELEQQQKQISLASVDPIKYNTSTQTSVREHIPESLAQDRDPKSHIIYKAAESNLVNGDRNGHKKSDQIIGNGSRTSAEWTLAEDVPPGTVVTPPPFYIMNSVKQSDSIEIAKKLRKAELMRVETTEQLIALRSVYEDLLKNYKNLMYKGKSRESADECTAVAVLRDKLVGKDREIEHQRHKIVELERKLWNVQIGY